MSGRLRAAVVGVGYWGRLHALKYAAMDGVELVAVADIDGDRAQQVADEVQTTAVDNHRELLGRMDLASVVVPGVAHFRVASELLDAGVHVLVEKPIATTLDQANRLTRIARIRGCKLQPGHIERFNPAWQAARARIHRPRRIEAHRLARFVSRGADVSVALDLMIHDLDLILSVVDGPPVQLRASGMRLAEGADVCHAAIEFSNGCIANVTASRISPEPLRRMRLLQHNESWLVDFRAHRLRASCRQEATVESVVTEQLEIPPGDALMSEIRAFVGSVRGGTTPPVTSEDGLKALELALEIERLIGASMLDAAGS